MKSLLNNSIFNAGGWTLQVILNAILIPVIIEHLGMDEFGLYTIALTIIGYFSIIQGINQASLKYLSEYVPAKDKTAISEILGSSLLISISVGMVGMAALYLGAGFLSTVVFKIPSRLQETGTRMFEMISAGFLTTAVGMTLTSIPQALHRYDISIKIMTVMGTLNLIISVLLVWAGYGILEIVISLVGISFLNAIVFFVVGRRLLRGIAIIPSYSARGIRRIIGFSSFSLISSLSSTAAYTLDRLMLGVLQGTGAVATYSVPHAPLSRVNILLSKLCEVLLPESSRLTSKGNNMRLEELYIKTSKYVLMTSLTIFIPVIIFSHEILSAWINVEVADSASPLLKLLSFAFLIKAQGTISNVLNLGSGRPHVNTRFALLTVALTAIFIYPAIKLFGLMGLAILSVLVSLQTPLFIHATNKHVLKQSSGRFLGEVVVRPVLVASVQALLLIAVSSMFSLPFAGVVLATVSSVGLNVLLIFKLNIIDAPEKELLMSKLTAFARYR